MNFIQFSFSLFLGYLIDIGGGCDVFVVVFPLTFLSSSYLNGGSDGGMLYPRASFKNEENEKENLPPFALYRCPYDDDDSHRFIIIINLIHSVLVGRSVGQ